MCRMIASFNERPCLLVGTTIYKQLICKLFFVIVRKSRRSSRARSPLAALETINEGEEVERFGDGRRQTSSRTDRSKKGSGRPSRRGSSSTSTSEVPSAPMTLSINNAASLSELHTYPFSSMETINTIQLEAGE